MSLLELVIATTMLSMVLTTVSVVMRTGRATWDAHEADFTRLEAAHATVRHVVRRIRQADEVLAISDPATSQGELSLAMTQGPSLHWQRRGDNRVYFGEGAADQLLAEEITGLRFIGYRADGVTATTVPSEIQALEVEATVQLPRETGGSRTIRSWAWVRVW